MYTCHVCWCNCVMILVIVTLSSPGQANIVTQLRMKPEIVLFVMQQKNHPKTLYISAVEDSTPWLSGLVLY